MASPAPTEPSPRRSHFSAPIGRRFWLYGGIPREHELPTLLHHFNVDGEIWEEVISTGEHPPPNLHSGCSTSSHHHVYLYGGHDGARYHNSLLQYDDYQMKWTQLAGDSAQSPMAKQGCGMVHFQNKLCLFGGWGRQPTGPTQPGAKYEDYVHGDVVTNELHMFDLREG